MFTNSSVTLICGIQWQRTRYFLQGTTRRVNITGMESLVPFIWGFGRGVWGMEGELWGSLAGQGPSAEMDLIHLLIYSRFLFISVYFKDRVSLWSEKIQTHGHLASASRPLSRQMWATISGPGCSLHLEPGGGFRNAYSLKVIKTPEMNSSL